MTNPEKILLVDDEEGLLTLLRVTLLKERYHNITCVTTGAEALRCVAGTHFDIILLDIMLPDYSGFSLCAEIRRQTSTPIIFLTACASDFDKLSGFAIGGDDYITKPFNTMEVVARIKAVFRRQKLAREPLPQEADLEPCYDYGYFMLQPSQAALTVAGKLTECTAKELELLNFFCRHPNKVFTATQLYDAVWALPGYGSEKTVTIHIAKLRKKLLDDDKPHKIIINLRGIGYKFVPPVGSSLHD